MERVLGAVHRQSARRRLTVLGVFGLLVLALLALRAADRAGTASAASKPLEKVTIIAGPNTYTAAILQGKRLGFYKKEGIDLTVQEDVPPPQYVPNVLAGNAQFGSLGWGGFISVVANKVPLVAIANLNAGASTSAGDDTQVVALRSSSIKSPRDLAGKTIAVPLLGGTPEISIRLLASRNGVDQKDLKFTQLNFPDMPAALRAGRVDAAYLLEPYIAVLRSQAPITLVSGGNITFGKQVPGANVFTSRAYLAAHKPIVDAMRRATNRSVDWAKAHPKQMSATFPSLLGLPAGVLKHMIAPNYGSYMDLTKLQRYITIAYNFKRLPEKFDIHTVVATK